MSHEHKWLTLPGYTISVRRKWLGSSAMSLYVVGEVCAENGCTVGRTEDGVTISNIKPGVHHLSFRIQEVVERVMPLFSSKS